MKTAATLKTLLIGLCLTPIASADIEIKRTEKALEAFASGKPVLTYHIATVAAPEGMDPIYSRSGFIHPLRSPSGKILTDAFPIGHVHQHAVFSAWTQATFKHQVVDFWNQHKKLGTAQHENVGNTTPDSFQVFLKQISHQKGAAIDESWTVSIEEQPNSFIVDIAIEQKCATADEVYLHPYHYGGFGLRGSAHWNEDDQTHFESPMKVLTGDGVKDIAESNHTTPRWIATYGPIDGATAGFVVMDHPSNFRFPQPVRVHPKMPYLVFSPVVKGSFILKPGLSYQSKYRIVTFDGEPDAERIQSWYENFSKR